MWYESFFDLLPQLSVSPQLNGKPHHQVWELENPEKSTTGEFQITKINQNYGT
jgi:hypothetical protein